MLECDIYCVHIRNGISENSWLVSISLPTCLVLQQKQGANALSVEVKSESEVDHKFDLNRIMSTTLVYCRKSKR